MKSLVFTAAVVCSALCLPVCSLTLAATRYADVSVSASGDGTSWETAFKTIQEGIDASSDGDTVIVAEGTYVENVKFNGKNIVLQSTDPLDPAIVANTIIDGNQAGSVLTFSGAENETCLMTGFTLRNGRGDYGGGICGGTWEVHTHARIENNTIRDNFAGQGGGGIALCDGVIRDNIISDNFADDDGGGLCQCHGLLESNVISDNSAHDDGGGLSACNGLIQRNTIVRNSAPDGYGGGLYECQGTIEDNMIADNSANYSGGLHSCNGTIQRNSISDNSAGYAGGLGGCDGMIASNSITGNRATGEGGGVHACNSIIINNLIAGNSASKCGGLSHCRGRIVSNTIVGNTATDLGVIYDCQAVIANCVIWANAPAEQPQIQESRAPAYSCVQNWTGGGEGNTQLNPSFVDVDGPDGDPSTVDDNDYRLTADSPCIDAGENGYWLGSPAWDADGNARVVAGTVDMGCYEFGGTKDTDGDYLSDDKELDRGSDPNEGDSDGDGLVDGLEVLRGTDPSVPSLLSGLRVPQDVKSIQEAIGLAFPGEEVVASPAVYAEHLHFLGKNIILRSAYPLNRDIVAQTIIEGTGGGSVITFAGTEDGSCVLSGFTVRGGEAARGGGISGNGTMATIRHNIITDNHVSDSGGGLLDCDGTIQGNVISNNRAGWGGGGLCYCNGIVTNNVVAANSAWSDGGGFYGCVGLIQNNLIVANSGSGLVRCGGMILNNTIVENSAYRGAGLYECEGMIVNCVVWGNLGTEDPQLCECSSPTYCCIEDWSDEGLANMYRNPNFVDRDGPDDDLSTWGDNDYRLGWSSPCIDAGKNGYWTGWPLRDLNGNARLVSARVDMGCYEYAGAPDADGDLLPNEYELALGTDPTDPDSDGDGLRDGLEVVRGTDVTQPDVPGTLHVPEDVATIQEAIGASVQGDELVLAPGTYSENIHFLGKSIILRSESPVNPVSVATTVIDGSGAGSVVVFWGTEGDACVLSGLTITNGLARDGAGIIGQGTRARIEHCTITGNKSTYGGGGLYDCDGLIYSNTVSNNMAERSDGGGLCYCDGVISSNTFSENSAAAYGGAIAYCHGTILNNRIFGNRAEGSGGALYGGGGLFQNNTVAGNSAGKSSSGIGYYKGAVSNCIVWGNVSPDPLQVTAWSDVKYCCIENWQNGGEGIIAYYPYFVNQANNDYHLLRISPCIDAGDPSSDYAEEPEPNGSRVNMGAYGNTAEAASRSPDIDQDSLPDEWEALFFGDLAQGKEDDSDGDGLSNIEEYHRGTPPIPVYRYVDHSVPDSGDGTSWPEAYKTIQEAMDEVPPGGTIIVAEGIYSECIEFGRKNVSLISTDPLNVAVVRNTVIDANRAGSVVTFSGAEDETCILSGFTIRNGRAPEGGGIIGNGTRATIQNVWIVSNIADSVGGGVARFAGSICNCVIAQNSAEEGGGLASCAGAITNCTIVENSAQYRVGGVYVCSGPITNCIIWANMAPWEPQLSSPDSMSAPTFSCIEGMPDVERGNISKNPMFVNWDRNDYHLLARSPCIDAGADDAYSLPEIDVDGEVRPFGQKIDIGVDEFVDEDGDALADYWEVEGFGTLEYGRYDDPDGDDLANEAELTASTDPNNPDTDGDELNDSDEIKLYNSDPLDSDSDDDGLTDGQEIKTYGTDPGKSDTDDDEMPDGWETQHGLDPLERDSASDPDGDGLTNLDEFFNSTDPYRSDSDGDNMPDGWEVQHNLDPLTPSGKGDPDGDKLPNLYEYNAGSDPNDDDTDDDGLNDRLEVRTYRTDPISPDTDADGIPDGWEATRRLDPLNPDATEDPDEDGLDNLGEYLNSTRPFDSDTDNDGKSDGDEVLAGTDPLDPASLLRIIEMIWSEAEVWVRWSAVPGEKYQLYFSVDLKVWSPVGKIRTVPAGYNELSFADQAAPAMPSGFYRVQVLP